MSTARQETDDRGAAPGDADDPIHDLQSSIAPMLLNVTLREETLRELSVEKREIAEHAIQLASRLQQCTEWTSEQLLERLGCTMSVSQLHDVSVRKLRSCEHFLGLVNRLAGCVDTKSDRRAVVLECTKLLRATRRDSHGLEKAIDEGAFPAVAYLELGEIASASALVRMRVGAEEAGTNPYAAAPVVHLSAPRIGMYLESRRDLLGDAVYERIKLHIAGCPECQEAVEHRRASQQAGYAHC